MNILELKEQIDYLLEQCSDENIDPSTIAVEVAYQPNYPMCSHRVSLGLLNKGTPEKPKLSFYVMESSTGNNYLPKDMSELEENLDYPIIDVINQTINRE